LSVVIHDTAIRMTRGDSLSVGIELKYEDGTSYTPVEGYSIRFALKHAAMTYNKGEFRDVEPVVTKAIPTDTLILELDPEDTRGLQFGNYVYDIELTYASGFVDTFISEGVFILAPDVD